MKADELKILFQNNLFINNRLETIVKSAVLHLSNNPNNFYKVSTQN